MRLFNDGRGLLRRVRWVRVIAVTAAIGAGVTWARRAEDEAAALGALKTITASSSSFTWREGDKPDDGTLDYGNLETLSNTTLIDDVLGGGGTRQGYKFETKPCQIPAGVLPVAK